jgi:50S ribosomal subunit-associated GTPase HflX
VDRLTHEEEAAARERLRALYPQPIAFASAVEEGGLDELRARIMDEIRIQRPEVEILIPAVDGEAIAVVYREGEVLRREERDMTISLLARLPRPALGRLRQRPGIEVVGTVR